MNDIIYHARWALITFMWVVVFAFCMALFIFGLWSIDNASRKEWRSYRQTRVIMFQPLKSHDLWVCPKGMSPALPHEEIAACKLNPQAVEE